MRGLYVHIPFCSVKCFYCDFTAFSGQRAQVSRYLKALEAEAALYGGLPVDTVYVGGGTPSELTAEGIGLLLCALEGRFGPLGALRESTFEANPESLTREKLELLRQRGVTRLSLGLETASPRLLKEIGRRHTVEEFIEVFRGARSLGFSLSVDLMTGLPTQTLEDASGSLEAVLALEPGHVSVYALRVEGRTVFARRATVVDESLEREMYEASLQRLAAAGYRHYEISNFALPGRESIHNLNYWRNGEYVGLGCGASGFLDGARYANLDSLGAYCSAAERGERPVEASEELSGKRRLGESVLLGLRLLEGIELTPQVQDAFPAEWRHLRERGWVETKDGRARLAGDGLFFANKVFEEFVEPFRSDEACLPTLAR